MFDTPSQLLQHAFHKKNVDYIVDQTHRFLIDPDKETFLKNRGERVDPVLLEQFKIFDDNAPYKESDTFDIFQFLVRANMSIGSIVTSGGDIPSTSAGQLIKVEGSMIKIALSHLYNEKIMEEILKMRQANLIPEAVVNLLYGSIDDLYRKTFKTGNVLTAQVWYQGEINFTDPRTDVGVEVKYDVRPQLFPDPLTGAEAWDNYDTANGIPNLIDHQLDFYRVNGFFPKCTKMSLDLINDLMQQQSTAALATSMGLINNHPTSNLPSRVTRKVLNQMVEETRELSMIEEWDTQYEIEIEPGVTQRVRYLPSHTYCFVNPNSVERLWGLTMESAMGQLGFGNRFKNSGKKPVGGIFTKANDNLKVSPPESRSIAVGRMLPYAPDARMLGGRKVKAA